MNLTKTLLIVAAGAAVALAQRGGPPRPAFQVTTTAFTDGGDLPVKYSCAAKADMVSPALTFANAPAGTASFALLLHDPEPHIRKSRYDITHWMIWNIPADARGLPENVAAGADLPDGSRQGKAYNQKNGYAGPCAPPGNSHHYTWEVFALDAKLDLSADATRDDFEKAIDGHVLVASEVVSLFHQ
jgi:Raf kinase inhibitor-like YbhB/YbcL family protein